VQYGIASLFSGERFSKIATYPTSDLLQGLGYVNWDMLMLSEKEQEIHFIKEFI
jgi:hypothetical protein